MFESSDSPAELAPDQRQRAWLASILLQSQRSWFGRFALQLRSLTAMRRGQRKRLERKAAVTLAGAALALSLGIGMMRAPAVYAASITVDNGEVDVFNDGKCSLVEAIINADGDVQLYGSPGECAAGLGADTINLPANGTFTLGAGYIYYYYYSDTGLPLITTEMTIAGNGSTIERDSAGGTPAFRILAVGTSGDLTLNDVTIKNGYSTEDGGGVYNGGGDVLIQDSTLTGNFAFDDGGAIENDEGGTMIIDNSVIEYNRVVEAGGGVSNESAAILTIQNGTIIRNNAADYGGGLAADISGLVTIDDSEISDNYAEYVGGGIAGYDSDFLIQNGATISGNEAQYIGGGGAFYLGDITITDSAISGNTVYYAGGGLFFSGSTTTIERSTIDQNDQSMYIPVFAGGGGIFNASFYNDITAETTIGLLEVIDSTVKDNTATLFGGGIANGFGAGLSVARSTISGNDALAGGGISNYDGNMYVVNSTVSNNTATADNTFGGFGGGILSATDVGSGPDNTHAVIALSTVTGNSATYSGGGLHVNNGDHYLIGSIVSGNTAPEEGNEIYVDDGGTLPGAYNVLGDNSETAAQAFYAFTPDITDKVATSDGTTPTALAGILNTTLAANGGPTLTHALVSGSPALDYMPDGLCAASTPVGDLSIDQRSFPRNIDIPGEGNDGTPEVCDVGAYELQLTNTVGAYCPADDEAGVGYLMTDLLGTGQGSKTKGYRTRKLVVPHPEAVSSLYGQLASTEVGTMKYVRFLPQGYPKIQIQDPTSIGYRAYAISWWGTDLPTDVNYVKGQFFWGAKANKSPRAFVLWPTYETEVPYANVFTTFDESWTNHVAWETGFIPVQTQTIAIPETQAAGATVTVRVAVVDNDNDDRPIFLDVTVGSQTQSNADTVPNAKDTLNIYELTFEDVEAGVNEVTIRLESPVPDLVYLSGGDSAAMIGAAVSYECEVPETPPPAPRPDAPAQSGGWSGLMARLQQARTVQPAAAQTAGEGNGRIGRILAQWKGGNQSWDRGAAWTQQGGDR